MVVPSSFSRSCVNVGTFVEPIALSSSRKRRFRRLALSYRFNRPVVSSADILAWVSWPEMVFERT